MVVNARGACIEGVGSSDFTAVFSSLEPCKDSCVGRITVPVTPPSTMKGLFDGYDANDIVGRIPVVHLAEVFDSDAKPALADEDDDGFCWRHDERGQTIKFCSVADLRGQHRVALGAGHDVSRAKHLRCVASLLRTYAEYDVRTWANGVMTSAVASAEELLELMPDGTEVYSAYRKRVGVIDGGDIGIYADIRLVSRHAALAVAQDLKESESQVDQTMGEGLEDRVRETTQGATIALLYVGGTLTAFGPRLLDRKSRLKGRTFSMVDKREANVITGQFIFVDTATIARIAKEAGVSAPIACDIAEGVLMTILDARYPNGQPNQAAGGGMVRGKP